MPSAVAEDKTLKLYTSDDGEVWFIDGDSPPTASGYGYAEVCDKLKIVKVANKPVRVSGGIENVKLINSLYDASKLGSIPYVDVCSPQVNRIDLDAKSPEKILLNMRSWKYPSSIGGYHRADDSNMASYRLANELDDLEKGLSVNNMPRLLSLYVQHPCYEYLKFIPFVSDESCILTLALILDPRWYVDLSFPNKLHNYYEHMGVGRMTPETSLSDITTKVSIRNLSKIQKRNSVLNSWQTPVAALASSAGYNFYDNFLVMTYSEAHKTFNISRTDAFKFDLADLITCQKFLTYVYYTWLDNLYTSPPWAEPLFVPELFFTSETETNSFKSKFCRKV